MWNTRTMIMNACMAALYAALTLGLAPLSYGPIQVRISEFLTLAAFYNPRYIPGLVIGCFIANIGSPFGLTDMIIGTLATCIALYAMRYCRTVWQASLMPVISNGIIIGLELAYLGEIPFDSELLLTMLYIGIGELIAVTVIGVGIMKLLMSNRIVRAYVMDEQ